MLGIDLAVSNCMSMFYNKWLFSTVGRVCLNLCRPKVKSSHPAGHQRQIICLVSGVSCLFCVIRWNTNVVVTKLTASRCFPSWHLPGLAEVFGRLFSRRPGAVRGQLDRVQPGLSATRSWGPFSRRLSPKVIRVQRPERLSLARPLSLSLCCKGPVCQGKTCCARPIASDRVANAQLVMSLATLVASPLPLAACTCIKTCRCFPKKTPFLLLNRAAALFPHLGNGQIFFFAVSSAHLCFAGVGGSLVCRRWDRMWRHSILHGGVARLLDRISRPFRFKKIAYLGSYLTRPCLFSGGSQSLNVIQV